MPLKSGRGYANASTAAFVLDPLETLKKDAVDPKEAREAAPFQERSQMF
jgi:hypothetical protein